MTPGRMVLPVPQVRAPVDIDASGNQFLERALLGLQQPMHVPDLEFHALAIVVAPDFFSRWHGLIPWRRGLCLLGARWSVSLSFPAANRSMRA